MLRRDLGVNRYCAHHRAKRDELSPGREPADGRREVGAEKKK